MASDVMRVRLHLRQIRVLEVWTRRVSWSWSRVHSQAAEMPGVRVRLRAGARHPSAQDPRPGGVGTAHDAGVGAARIMSLT